MLEIFSLWTRNNWQSPAAREDEIELSPLISHHETPPFLRSHYWDEEEMAIYLFQGYITYVNAMNSTGILLSDSIIEAAIHRVYIVW